MSDNSENKNHNIVKTNPEEEVEAAQVASGHGNELGDTGINDSDEITSNGRYAFPLNSYPRPRTTNNEVNDENFSHGEDCSDSVSSSSTVRPGVEWIYPGDYEGPRHEFDSDVNTEDQSSETIAVGEIVEDTSIDYVVDPNNVEVTLAVDGIVVPPRLYFLKICGVVICDDNFPFLVNSKVFAFILGALLIASLSAAAILAKKDVSTSYTGHQNTDTIESSEGMHENPVIIDPRITNITQAIFEISGNVAFEKNSSQNQALNWVLHEDSMELVFNSSNLLQRYAIMVFFFNLSGANWFQNDGYRSGKHECDWHGVLCRRSNGHNRIYVLKMENNNLNGQIPNEIKLLSHLSFLVLPNNSISGKIPSSIGQLGKLKRLHLSGNRLSGAIPVEITNCRNLNDVLLNNNRIHGSIPEFGRNQWSLSFLHLSHNKLSGRIPTSIGGLSNVQILLLHSNRLTGSIPQELGNAEKLYVLNLEGNNLTGEIPSSIALLPDLRAVDLSHNLLSGTVPINFYRHQNVNDLRLCDNALTGTIPNVSDLLPMAENILLHSNLINGTVPVSIGNLPRLKLLKLHFSMLSGTVPENLCDLKLESLTVNCGGEDPEVFCSCCTECF